MLACGDAIAHDVDRIISRGVFAEVYLALEVDILTFVDCEYKAVSVKTACPLAYWALIMDTYF